ncbi:hypothetical protein ACIQZG_18035 [Lysinibacillus sp. NPDC096418]|uniref:hypothetical protein n=1 Tax=Lysinibacillus sp. NPDC096418 TaxID=3364138 RepID=UPI00381DA0FA
MNNPILKISIGIASENYSVIIYDRSQNIISTISKSHALNDDFHKIHNHFSPKSIYSLPLFRYYQIITTRKEMTYFAI